MALNSSPSFPFSRLLPVCRPSQPDIFVWVTVNDAFQIALPHVLLPSAHHLDRQSLSNVNGASDFTV